MIRSSTVLKLPETTATTPPTTMTTITTEKPVSFHSLEIFAKTDEEFRGSVGLGLKASISDPLANHASREHSREGDNKARISPGTTAAASVSPGASEGKHTRSPVAPSTHER